MAINLRARVIQAGYPWRVRLQFANSLTFDVGATLVMQVRANVDDAQPIVSLTTENGGVTRVDNTTLVITIPATSANLWPIGKTVVMDLVRTDGGSPEHTGFRLKVPVRNPVTRL
ncbi:hypothetical protein NKK48_01495 [Mesorhizobium sp. C386A]|uniref:hypothetical protein n=1 Tax=unclassified Mesorhizobium TaxID=325217 RepID=UPI0003CF56B8|nr:hypothetical protein [Mesorhizobium sp. LNJC386A00]ESY35393.1 hypothetical protein X748_14180 [Mesorhizobium sp. LNJC386A00]